MQGRQIVLQVMFETSVGSDQMAEAGGMTISITAATDSTGQPGPDRRPGHAPPGHGRRDHYRRFVPLHVHLCRRGGPGPRRQPGPWSGMVAGVQQTWQQTITITLPMTGAPAPGAYATVAQYCGEREDHATPDWLVSKEIRRASRIIRHATIGAVYDHTPSGVTSTGIVIQTFMEAIRVEHGRGGMSAAAAS